MCIFFIVVIKIFLNSSVGEPEPGSDRIFLEGAGASINNKEPGPVNHFRCCRYKPPGSWSRYKKNIKIKRLPGAKGGPFLKSLKSADKTKFLVQWNLLSLCLLSIQKDYFGAKKTVLDVDIKAFWYRNYIV